MLLAMFLFSLSMSLSPGPVNMVILSTGATYGAARALPFVSDATVGFVLLLLAVGLVSARALAYAPGLMQVLGWAGAAFIMWIGWRIARSDDSLDPQARPAPSFAQGFALQWLNPKAWIACTAGTALFAPKDDSAALMHFALVYFAVCYASLACWAGLGTQLARWLTTPRRRRGFNCVMGGSLIASALYALAA